MDFKATWEPDKLYGSGWPSKRGSLQDRANFHRSWVWQTPLIFNPANVLAIGLLHIINWITYFRNIPCYNMNSYIIRHSLCYRTI